MNIPTVAIYRFFRRKMNIPNAKIPARVYISQDSPSAETDSMKSLVIEPGRSWTQVIIETSPGNLWYNPARKEKDMATASNKYSIHTFIVQNSITRMR